MRLLIVDDERLVRDALQRKLYHDHDDWEIECVGSGAEALAELNDDDYDVIVSDMRMPGMDGAELLAQVQERWPGTVRIVMSGYMGPEELLRVARVSHQFLDKPCPPSALERVLSRAQDLRSLLTGRVRDILGELDSLPSLPSVYEELTRALANPQCTADDVAAVVSRDPAMSAKVLQLVNSSYFARASAIESVSQAVMRLGFDMVKSLALSVELFSCARVPRSLGLDLEELQRHSLETAVVASKMLRGDAAKEAFTAGMLHDVGTLVLATRLSDSFGPALEQARATGRPLPEVERELIGADHATIGGYLLGLWGLPYAIVDAVTRHHDLTPSDEGLGVREAVTLANVLSRDGQPDAGYVEELGCSANLGSWRQALEQARERS